MDDAGYKLIKSSNNKGIKYSLGTFLIKALPLIIKFLAVVGTLALLLVSGGIFVHNIEYFHHLLPNIPSTLKEFIFGILAGIIVVAIVTIIKKIVKK